MHIRLALTLVMSFAITGAAFAQSANDVGTHPRSTYQKSFAAAVVSGSGSFTGTEATMTPRFFRPGSPGLACSTTGSGNYQYVAVPFTTDSSGTLSATFDPGTCGVNIYVTFHNFPADPANICTNFVWADGSSVAFTQSFPVTPNQSMLMVVSGVSNAPGVVCGPYTYSLTGTAAVPVMNTLGLMGLSALLVGVAVWTLRKRRGMEA